MWWMLPWEVLNGSVFRECPWEVILELCFYRDPDDVEKEEQATAG